MRAGGRRELGDVAPRPAFHREDNGLCALQLRPVGRYAATVGFHDGPAAEGFGSGEWRAGNAARFQSSPGERGRGRLQPFHGQPVQLQRLGHYLSDRDCYGSWARFRHGELRLHQRLRGQFVFGRGQPDLVSRPAYLQSRSGVSLHSGEPELRGTRNANVFHGGEPRSEFSEESQTDRGSADQRPAQERLLRLRAGPVQVAA